jgi:hypothetical protein
MTIIGGVVVMNIVMVTGQLQDLIILIFRVTGSTVVMDTPGTEVDGGN